MVDGKRQYQGLPAPKIHLVRGIPVVLDEEVAKLFGVTTTRLNEQIKRNAVKFGNDFAFQLSAEEYAALKSQFATSSGHGGRRKPPFGFTEHGVVMAATVLKSDEAGAATRFIVNVFIEARRNQLAGGSGRNLPAVIDPRSVLPISTAAKHGLMGKLNDALGKVLDAIAEPQTGATVRDEVRAIAAEGLNAIKEHLKRTGVQNEKTLAEVRKLLAEADSVEAETIGKHTQNQHRHLALLAKKLRLALEAQRYLETGSVEGLMSVLKDMERD
ncbi:MAG TPA: ORF6N domain-containing protein [Hyphomonadaceae bacterium]|nr:ORF6N domain-containing protein [Hyphomonadaceae bacterium]